MSLADKPEYESRRFLCGWAPRREGVLAVASRLQAMAARLESIEPGLGQLWPQFEMRGIRPADPGPLLALSEEDLARLIDRRGRADPPAPPAPVSAGGYQVSLAGLRGGRIGVGYGGNIWVESSLYSLEQPVRLSFDIDDPIWRSPETARRILFALVDAWSAHWAAATAFVGLGVRDDGESMAETRPWMAWAATGHQVPKHWVSDGGKPIDVRSEQGGRLRTWFWPPTYPRPPL